MIVSETDKSLGKKLRQLREGRGLSQEKLAREIGVVFQQILKYEAGINRISCSRLLKILDVLDISIIDFFAGIKVSDHLIIRMAEERIGKEDCRHGFLLDGFPRTLNQAEILEGMLAEKRQKLDAVIEIQVPDEIIMERILGRYACMKCGRGYHDKFLKPKIYGVCDECGGTEFSRRHDDNRTTVHNRLVNFRALTYPTIPFFEKKGLLRCVDGTGTIEAVAG